MPKIRTRRNSLREYSWGQKPGFPVKYKICLCIYIFSWTIMTLTANRLLQLCCILHPRLTWGSSHLNRWPHLGTVSLPTITKCGNRVSFPTFPCLTSCNLTSAKVTMTHLILFAVQSTATRWLKNKKCRVFCPKSKTPASVVPALMKLIQMLLRAKL